jgi:hypothetical protein
MARLRSVFAYAQCGGIHFDLAQDKNRVTESFISFLTLFKNLWEAEASLWLQKKKNPNL